MGARVTGCRACLGGNENILKLAMVTDALLCEYSKSHWIVQVGELYLMWIVFQYIFL